MPNTHVLFRPTYPRMTLKGALSSLLSAEAKACGAVCSTKFRELAANELKAIHAARVHVVVDGSWLFRAACEGLIASRREQKMQAPACERDVRDFFFAKGVIGQSNVPGIARVSVLFDTGVPKCKKEEAAARRAKRAPGYPPDTKMQAIASNLDVEKFVETTSLREPFIERALTGSLVFHRPEMKCSISMREGLWQNDAKGAWRLDAKVVRPQLEADLAIPAWIRDDESSDAFVVATTDGDMMLGLFLMWSKQHAEHKGDTPFRPRPTFLIRQIPGHEICIRMDLLYLHWVSARRYKNVLGLLLAQLLTGCDYYPFRKKLLFDGIGNDLVAKTCLQLMTSATFRPMCLDAVQFADLMLAVYRECMRAKKTKPVRNNFKATPDTALETWKEEARREYPYFVALSMYLSGDMSDSVQAQWN